MGNQFIKLAWAKWDSTMKLEKTSATLASPGRSSSEMRVAIPVSLPMPKQNISNSVLPFSPRVSTTEATNADTQMLTNGGIVNPEASFLLQVTWFQV